MSELAGPVLDRALWVLVAGGAAGCVAFVRGLALWRRRRAIEDTPTARIRSLALGRVEIAGVARRKEPMLAPLSGVPCVWFRYQIEREARSSRNRRSWTTIDEGDSCAWPFYAEDSTGRIRIEPQGASIEVTAQLRETGPELVGPLARFVSERGLRVTGWLGGSCRLRITEARIHDGDPLYVHGVAQARAGVREEKRLEIAERVREIKSDPARMAALDTDGDGQVSVEEWDAARVRVVTEVEGRTVEDAVCIAKDPLGATPFLLAARSESALLRSLAWRVPAYVFGGALVTLVCLGLVLERLRSFGRM